MNKPILAYILILAYGFGAYFLGRSRTIETSNCPPCNMVHCTPEDTMKDLNVLELKDGESLTVTKQGDNLVFTVKALSK